MIPFGGMSQNHIALHIILLMQTFKLGFSTENSALAPRMVHE
jgi:hypothetical protein